MCPRAGYFKLRRRLMTQKAANKRESQQQRRFKLTRKIGSGGQGVVYKAWDRALDRTVAVKLISPDGVGRGTEGKSFPNEARMAARLQHPNIIPIYDVGSYQGRPLLVFEFVEGRTFRDMITADGAIAPRRAVALFRPVLEGMAHAHERNVLHLDLTPGNVLVSTRDVPRIMDFGLSQMMNSVPEGTTVLMGTLLYMAPEQLAEEPPGPPTDVRSLGLIFYEMLTGERAIKAKSIKTAARLIYHEDIDLEPLNSGPEMAPLIRFLAGALSRDPLQRYPTATAMLNAFDDALQARERLAEAVSGTQSSATVEFLLRRMQRHEDFPALSRSLVEINRMTSSDSNATAEQLSMVVLRDYALTNKLLKLANSAYYGSFAGEVKSVSHAISLIGFEQLRITANCLTLFAHIKDRSQSTGLTDLQVRSFFTALLARHLARHAHIRNVEEAFICGMFQTLGETLVRFYFQTEFSDIEEIMRDEGCDELTATRLVLGVDYATLGSAVASEWRFPVDIVTAIAGLADEEPVAAPASAAQSLRDVAVFADRVSRILAQDAHPGAGDGLAALCRRFAPSIQFEATELIEIANAAVLKLDQYAIILGIDVARSVWIPSAKCCLDGLLADVAGEDPDSATSQPASGRATGAQRELGSQPAN